MVTTNTKKIETLDDILSSSEFNNLFDIESEIKEVESAGWTIQQCLDFGKQMAKKIK